MVRYQWEFDRGSTRRLWAFRLFGHLFVFTFNHAGADWKP